MAANDFLFEETVLIADGTAVTGQTMCGERIDETCRQTSETAVTETGVGFLLVDVVEIEVEVFQDFAEGLVDSEVDEVGFEQASHQKFNREIVDLLLLTIHVGAICLDPVLADDLFGDGGDGLVDFVHRQFVNVASEHDVRRADEPRLE